MWQIQWLNSVASTQSELKARLQNGVAKSGDVLATESQTQGYGRQQRVWQSPPGNLAVSCAFSAPRPSVAYQYSLVAALCLCEMLELLLPQHKIRLKWPNDVWCEDLKIAGFLSELLPDSQTVILGFGLNLNSTRLDFPKDLQERLITLKDVLGQTVSAADFLSAYLQKFGLRLSQFHDTGFKPFLPDITERLQFLGETVQLNEGPNLSAEGTFVGLDDKGFLVLRDTTGVVSSQISGDLSLRLKKEAYVAGV